MDDTKTGFKSSTDFCLHLERIKQEQELDTYMETVLWYAEHESDLEFEQIVRYLNKKIHDSIEYEAIKGNMLKDKDVLVSLF